MFIYIYIYMYTHIHVYIVHLGRYGMLLYHIISHVSILSYNIV